MTDSPRNEPLSDDMDMMSPREDCPDYVGGSDGALADAVMAKPGQGCATVGGAVVAEYASMGTDSDDVDSLQWRYTPKSGFLEAMNRLVPHGGGLSNVYNMCAVTLGSGIFSLPYAFRSTGIAVAVIVLAFISLATVYSVYIMVQAVEKTRVLAKQEMANRYNLHSDKAKAVKKAGEGAEDTSVTTPTATEGSSGGDGKKHGFVSGLRHLSEGEGVSPLFLCSYESLSRGLLGRGWDYFAAFNMWFFCFGSCVSYVIVINDLISTALKPSPGDAPRSGFLYSSEWGSKVLTIVVWALVMLPLSIPKQVNSLRYASVIGVTFIMYFVVVVIVHSGMNSFEHDAAGHLRLKNKLKAARSGNDALVGFSMFLFAFLLQTNVLQIAKEAKRPSPARLTRDCGIATAICTTLYILTGFFGYAEFGEALEGTVLREYNVRTEPAVAVGYVMLGFKISVSFAICMLPSRDAVYYCIGADVRTIRWVYHVGIIVVMSVIALILGLVIPDVEIVFSLVGSLAGGFLGFVFPALFVMYAGDWSLKSVGLFHWVCTYVLLLSGVVAIIFGTVASIYGMM